jgi:hypothetical protein
MTFSKKVFHGLASLKLSLALLLCSFLLVFFGTLAQVELGIHGVQNIYFKSFFVAWPYPQLWPGGEVLGAYVRVPLLGGYSLGGLILTNLICAHIRYFSFKSSKIGIVLIHVGLGVLVFSGFVSAYFQEESQMCLTLNEAKQYTEDFFQNELVLIDTSQASQDRVWAIPQGLLSDGSVFYEKGFPRVQVVSFFKNSYVLRKNDLKEPLPCLSPTEGLGAARDLIAIVDKSHKPDAVDTASAYVQLFDEDRPLGLWLVSNILDEKFPPQTLKIQESTYQLALRFQRTYFDFQFTLLEFKHEKHPGTDIPKSFSSLIRIQNKDTKEDREVLISMNQPLRYKGYTFYQSSFSEDERSSILQVVKNPGWAVPYAGIALVSLGLCLQFLKHLMRFLKRHEANA